MKVNISGTMAKDKRADSGLDDIGDKMNVNRLQRMVVVGIIEYHGHHEVVGQPETVSVRFAAIEPLEGKDDVIARNLLDKARRGRGLGSTELTLFDAADGGDDDGPWPGDPDFMPPGASSDTEPPADPPAADPPAAEAKPRKATKRALASVPQ
jgi:hypothetical protein